MRIQRFVGDWVGVVVFCLWVISASAQSNVVVGVMAANLTSGNNQSYLTPGLDIFAGLKPDVVAIQEFNYTSVTTNGVNTPAAFREMIDTAFGTNFVYYREPYAANGDIPNGIISRYPILASGSWVDTQVANRGFAWAQINLPGTNNLYFVSVHLLTTSAANRETEASNLMALIQANFPSNAWIIVAGDFNTDTRTEAAIVTLSAIVSDTPIPVDNLGNSDTSINRDHPHDYVLDSYSMTNTFTPVVLPSNTFSNGLVFDSRVYTPLGDVPPIQLGDSGADGMQHMPVVKDFLVPVALASGALLSVSPADGLTSVGPVAGPFNPTSQTYTIANAGDSNLTWGASIAASWLTLSSTSGTLAPNSNTTVTVSLNANANSLPAGGYLDTVIFTNTTNAAGSTTRPVSLTVNSTFPVIVTNGWTLSAENCLPTNGVVDPGETVTVNFVVKNTGTAATTNLVATLVASGDVNSPSSPQFYGLVPANGTPVSQPFSFTAGSTCGGVITATLQLQDGVADLGTISFPIPLGVTAAVFAQNFDSVSAPSLPVGWATSASGAQSNWVTSTTSADTVPNAAFSPDPGSDGVNELDMPSIPINSSVAQLTFRQNYGLAASVTNSSIGYDGGVLEIAIGGGSYTDIVAAGGAFVNGGYNTTLSGLYGNPLAGGQAWSGNSGGFTTTVVNLPASAAGQNIQLRWRCASGNTPPPVASSGTLAYWNFDASTPVPNTVGANLSVSSVSVTNASGALTYFGGNPSSGEAIAASGFTLTAGPPTTSFSCFTFSITVSNGAVVGLSSVSFDDRASGTGPTKYSVQVSQQANFSTLLYDSGIQSAHTAFTTTPMNSFALTSSNLSGTIYFRIYAYQAGASGGTWRVDNLNVQGGVTSGGSTAGSGWYVDSVSIQDAFCCTNFVTPPVADFVGSPSTGTAPLTVTFNDNSTGTISNWFWDFGDSSTTNVTTNSVVHTYAAGTYGVTLIASGPSGASTNTKPLYITAWTPFQAWQIQYFGSTTNPAAAASADPDGDGQNNLAEFLAGTDPTNGASALRITSITAQGPNIQVNWMTGAGKTNALQATGGGVGDVYATNGFADIVVITNTVGTFTNAVDVGGATNVPSRYYRVRLVP
jgi:PKD repeat protein/endonuclease/exonuclease/phosphatase family metal-dependent hydrolase